ncbi:hypothetical protein [Streptosporangium sp. KLBMP 9127]|nr:hypothetical protein [Streptosporangium sp. KLBMP 9127]
MTTPGRRTFPVTCTVTPAAGDGPGWGDSPGCGADALVLGGKGSATGWLRHA